MKKILLQKKLARLETGSKLRVLDLFSGCGGLSLGFQSAGCEIAASIEMDEPAAKTHGQYFFPGSVKHSISRDVTKTSPQKLVEELDLGPVDEAFDIIIGGPPCQAFARVGRSKLREVDEHPEAFRHDPRAKLYIQYLEYVNKCKPLAILMENVPDILNHGGHNLAEEICEVLENKGYHCKYTLLNAAFYGVPQMRERMFLIGIRKELITHDFSWFPNPTHFLTLPSGYEGSRAVALKALNTDLTYQIKHHYITPPSVDLSLKPAITAKDALDDLPVILARELLASGELTRGARKFDKELAYPSYDLKKLSSYANKMRVWNEEYEVKTIRDHVIRYLPRDYETFSRMKPGDQYPEAKKVALERFFEEIKNREKSLGFKVKKNSPLWNEIYDEIVPPYDDAKFPNKWRKMEAYLPARTLMAHLGKDSYSHIHYDDRQARTISVREAARLQSFPDEFLFYGSMNHAFRQIGNAVPPILSQAIAKEICKQIQKQFAKTQIRSLVISR